MFKVNNKNTYFTYLISEHISLLYLVFVLLIFEQENVGWDVIL